MVECDECISLRNGKTVVNIVLPLLWEDNWFFDDLSFRSFYYVKIVQCPVRKYSYLLCALVVSAFDLS